MSSTISEDRTYTPWYEDHSNKPQYEEFADVHDLSGPLQISLLVEQADKIAKGLSRFSFVPPNSFGRWTQEDIELAKPFPGDLQVECKQNPREKNVYEYVEAYVLRKDAHETILMLPDHPEWGLTDMHELSTSYEYLEVHSVEHNMSVPNCDYEEITSCESIETEPNKEGWSVYDRRTYIHDSVFHLIEDLWADEIDIPDYEQEIWWIVGFAHTKDEQESLDIVLPRLTQNESLLPLQRKEDWQYGRRVRDGLKFRFGVAQYVYGFDDMDVADEYEFFPYPGSFEFQVEYSILSGPGDHGINREGIRFGYTLSSWSLACPYYREGK